MSLLLSVDIRFIRKTSVVHSSREEHRVTFQAVLLGGTGTVWDRLTQVMMKVFPAGHCCSGNLTAVGVQQ